MIVHEWTELVKWYEKVSYTDHIISFCFLIWRGGLKEKETDNLPQLKQERKQKHRLEMFNTN